MYTFRKCGLADISTMVENQTKQGLPGTVSLERNHYLMEISEIAAGAFKDDSLVGFVICSLPKRNYGNA